MPPTDRAAGYVLQLSIPQPRVSHPTWSPTFLLHVVLLPHDRRVSCRLMLRRPYFARHACISYPALDRIPTDPDQLKIRSKVAGLGAVYKP